MNEYLTYKDREALLSVTNDLDAIDCVEAILLKNEKALREQIAQDIEHEADEAGTYDLESVKDVLHRAARIALGAR